MEAFEETIVAAAVVEAMQLGAISFDAVKQLVLARIERRPAGWTWPNTPIFLQPR
jgi:hypothetical protein